MGRVIVIRNAVGELVVDLVDEGCGAAWRRAACRGNRLPSHVLRLEPDRDDLERLAAGLNRRQHRRPLWLGLAELMAVDRWTLGQVQQGALEEHLARGLDPEQRGDLVVTVAIRSGDPRKELRGSRGVGGLTGAGQVLSPERRYECSVLRDCGVHRLLARVEDGVARLRLVLTPGVVRILRGLTHINLEQLGRLSYIGLQARPQRRLVGVAGPQLREVVGLGNEVRILGEHLVHFRHRRLTQCSRRRSRSEHRRDSRIVRQVELQRPEPLQVALDVRRGGISYRGALPCGEHQHDRVSAEGL